VPAPPRVLAHRGLALDAPENTLLSFLHALSIGVTHLETDVHGSADGVAIISHDPDLKRLTGRDEKVGELTAAELRAIDLGNGQTFCTLAEALDAFPEARFNIDVKDRAAVAPTVAAVREAHAEKRVLIGSFSSSRRRDTVKQLPGAMTSISSMPALLAVLLAKLGAVFLLRPLLGGVQAAQLPYRKFGLRITSARAIRSFHSCDVEVHAWTVNDPDEMRRLLDDGIDGLVTDRADLALALMNP
jgi:glycerophosphoryl diester phosphodiesterase